MSVGIERLTQILRDVYAAVTVETLLWCALIGCSLFVTLQLLVMWQTRRNDQQLMAKSFFLSLLVHFCLGLGWATVALTEPMPMASSDHAEPVSIQLAPFEGTASPPAGDLPFAGGGHFSETLRTTKERQLPRREADNLAVLPPEQISAAVRLPIEVPTGSFTLIETAVSPVEDPERVSSASSDGPKRSAVAVDVESDAAPEVRSRPEPRLVDRARQSVREQSQTGSGSPKPQIEPPLPRTPTTPGAGTSSGERTQDLLKSSVISSTPGLREEPALGSPFSNRVQQDIPIRATSPAPGGSVREYVYGIVTDKETGQRLGDVTIRLDRIQGKPIEATTAKDGRYELAASETPDNFAIVVTREGYLPESRNVRGAALAQGPRLDFAMRPINRLVLVTEDEPTVHHLGNDRFEGRANSQFQHATEGKALTLTFEFARRKAPLNPRPVVTFMAKGIQCLPRILLNGTPVAQGLAPSPADGSFGEVVLAFDSRLLREGENQLQFQAVNCNGDLDDFEFVNVQIQLSRAE